MLLENPRKIPHEELFNQELERRMQACASLREILDQSKDAEGKRRLQFSKKDLYRQFRAAFYLADLAHGGQKDKGGVPYICHPVMVSMRLMETQEPSVKRDRAMIAALLHDVLEDTPVTEKMLKSFPFDQRVISTVLLLTRSEGEPYDEYLKRLMKKKAAVRVKIADMTDNQNLNRILTPSQRDVNRSEFYRSCKRNLEDYLEKKENNE